MRKKTIQSLILIGLTQFCFAQTQNPMQILRYNDQFEHLKTDSTRAGFDKHKMFRLGKANWFSWGGDLREQLYLIANPNFGDVPPTFKKASVTQHWHRAMLHAQLELGQNYKIFVQLNNTNRFLNPNPLTLEVDENQLSLHQCFVDWKSGTDWRVRVGRQEVIYGNSRLLSVRDLPNTRLSFDGATLRWKKKDWTVDVLSVSPVIGKPKIGDDVTFTKGVTGIYATQKIIPNRLSMDYYALHFRSNGLKYGSFSGAERRSMLGLRAFSTPAKLNYELELTYQFGSFNEFIINALSIGGDIHYQFSSTEPLTIGLSWSYQSGDKDPFDRQLNTYNPLYARAPFGVAIPLSLANIAHWNPYFRYKASPELTLYGGFFAISRTSLQEGVYTPSMVQGRTNGNNLKQNVDYKWGNQYYFDMTYNPNFNWSYSLIAAFTTPGDYAIATGKGGIILFLSPKVSFKF